MATGTMDISTDAGYCGTRESDIMARVASSPLASTHSSLSSFLPFWVFPYRTNHSAFLSLLCLRQMFPHVIRPTRQVLQGAGQLSSLQGLGDPASDTQLLCLFVILKIIQLEPQTVMTCMLILNLPTTATCKNSSTVSLKP